MAATQIGFNTNMKEVYRLIKEGALPYIVYNNFAYLIDPSAESRGMVYYTVFLNAGKTPEYSIIYPLSYALTLGETIIRGDGLKEHLDPIVTEFPTFS